MNDKLIEELKKNWSEYKQDKLLPLMLPTYGVDEIIEINKTLFNHWITKGPKVKKFENDFCNFLDIKYSLMLNSGSSANLLALSILTNPNLKNRIKKGDEIIVPAVTWSTTIFPIIQIGAIPVFADVDEYYQINIDSVKKLINERTKAIFCVHLLGNACDIEELKKICQEHNLWLIEDCCEALGTEVNGKKVGIFGDLSTFSFYFSHHITTGEGGMLCTNNDLLIDIARSVSAHGYIREYSKKEEIIKKYPDLDSRFLFLNLGYNFRATDLQASFGIHQLKKLNIFLKKRKEFALKLLNYLKKYDEFLILPKVKDNVNSSWFVFPISIKKNSFFIKKDLIDYLEKNGIETRPLVCGNFLKQPVMQYYEYKSDELIQTNFIHENSFYIGIHPFYDDELIMNIFLIFKNFFENKVN